MQELLEALVVDDGDLDLEFDYLLQPGDVIECCKSLVVHEASSGVARFSHYTVQDAARVARKKTHRNGRTSFRIPKKEGFNCSVGR